MLRTWRLSSALLEDVSFDWADGGGVAGVLKLTDGGGVAGVLKLTELTIGILSLCMHTGQWTTLPASSWLTV